MTLANDISVGLAWHNFSTTVSPLKVLLMAASMGPTEAVS